MHMLSHAEVANARPAVIYCFRTGLPVLVKAQLLDIFFGKMLINAGLLARPEEKFPRPRGLRGQCPDTTTVLGEKKGKSAPYICFNVLHVYDRKKDNVFVKNTFCICNFLDHNTIHLVPSKKHTFTHLLCTGLHLASQYMACILHVKKG
jgi:hypothetical protein